MPPRRSRLQKCLELLAEHQGSEVQAPPADPWAAILWENVVYLTDDARRAAAFAALEQRTGLRADAIARAPDEVLLPICGHGKMAAERVQALRDCAACHARVGDPGRLVALPPEQARRALREFPGIGAPGADRLLLFAGRDTPLTVESNGLRVLQRLGYGGEEGDYARQLRTACEAAAPEVPEDAEVRADLWRRLRWHGQTICRKRPHCDACPIARHCDSRRGDGMNH